MLQLIEQHLLQNQAVYRTVSCPDLEKGARYIPQGFHTTALNNTTLDSEEQIDGIETNPRASIPVEKETEAGKLPKKVTLQEILYHPGAFCVPMTDIIATPGLQGPINNNLAHSAQRLQNMA